MCVSVTDAFRVSGPRRVTDTWRTNISLSKKCTSTYLFQSASAKEPVKVDFGDNAFEKKKDSVGDNKVVITRAKLQVCMLDES